MKSNTYIYRNVTIFTVFTLGLPWVGRWLDVSLGNPPDQGIGIIIWIVTPFLISLLLRGFAGDGWKDLGIQPNFKEHLRWYALSIFVYPVCATLIMLIGMAFGVISCSELPPDAMEAFVQGAITVLITQIIKNIFEEFTFRGYLAPKIYSLKLNTMMGHGIVGLIWGCWHLPYLLIAVVPYTTESLLTLIPRFLLAAVAASIVYGEIRLRTNSVWPAWLMHTVGATFISAFIMSDMLNISKGMEFLFAPVFEGGIMLLFFTSIGIGLYLLRRTHLLS